MVKFNEICDWIQEQDKAIKFVNILPIQDFLIEERVTKKGKI